MLNPGGELLLNSLLRFSPSSSRASQQDEGTFRLLRRINPSRADLVRRRWPRRILLVYTAGSRERS